MINIAINNEKTVERAQQLGHHQNLQDAVEKAVEHYVQYLEQQTISEEFGTVDFAEDYDYKQQRRVR
ncbi:MAG: hypothetical protein Q8N96_03315 [Methylovulum sp.]|nr:hypothetical protein [Methylovulum sp.]